MISPPDRTAAVCDLLLREPGATHVALLAGAAGMVSLTSARSAALVGVFTSVATVPSAGFAAVALVEGLYLRAAESLLQLVVDLVGVVIAAMAVLLLSRRRRGWHRSRGSPATTLGARATRTWSRTSRPTTHPA